VQTTALFRDHRRHFQSFRYVYPVVSRRSGGLSIGINLNPDKACNFDCIYCQVDRRTPAAVRDVQVDTLIEELHTLLEMARSGALFAHEPFAQTPFSLRCLRDIAFSGDGEPTAAREFPEVVRRVTEIKKDPVWTGVKLVLITNATLLHRPEVAQALTLLDQHEGEIWAKLDAGTEAYYHLVDRTTVPFARVLDNICQAARQRPIVIQSLFMRIHGQAPAPTEIAAYCQRLTDILRAGGQIRLVQVYTVARSPAESYVTPLRDTEVDAIAEQVRRTTGLPAHSYYAA